MGFVVITNTDVMGQNFLCRKHDPPSKKKKRGLRLRCSGVRKKAIICFQLEGSVSSQKMRFLTP